MTEIRKRVRQFLVDAADAGDVEASPPSPRISKYFLKREVGRGGMGTVWEALDPELNRRVALKTLREGQAAPEVITRLHREAAIAAQLQHPNIVPVYEVGMVNQGAGQVAHFIAMAFVDGRTLGEILREGRTSRQDLLRIL